MRHVAVLALSSFLLFACSDEAGGDASNSEALGGGGSAGDGGSAGSAPSERDTSMFDSGTEVRFDVPESGRVYLDLHTQKTVGEADGWELAFEGYEVFTNSGVSGTGTGGAFGPLESEYFPTGEAPAVPFMMTDTTGGAFAKWYFYEGAPAHALWSRFHIYGVRDGERTWKLQVLSYYGEMDGAPTAALYGLRYAELLPSGASGPTQTLSLINATAGGTAAPPSEPSACLNLATGEQLSLTPQAAQGSTAWHVCLRRDGISVNGEQGGPGSITAVDLDAASTDTEQLSEVKKRNPSSEQARFDAVTISDFKGLTFRGDHVRTAFTDQWLDPPGETQQPKLATWIVVASDAASRFFVGFTKFEGATSKSPGTVVLRLKSIKLPLKERTKHALASHHFDRIADRGVLLRRRRQPL